MFKFDNWQNTKILATVGPASSSYENLLALVKAGVDVFRLNFSHGSHEDHLEVINRVGYINEKYGIHIGLLADLQGPKLRVGEMKDGGVPFEAGDVIVMGNEKCIGTKEKVYMSYESFAKDIKVGERVLVDDGKLIFDVIDTDGEHTVKLRAMYSGVLRSNKGVNLPNTKISLPSLTEKDLKDLDFILTQPFNWIALSFVRSPKDMAELRAKVDAKGHPAKLISKIEKPEAIHCIKDIIKESNAVMIARGDLGVEMPMEQLPLIQKSIIKKCLKYARPVIVATQMLDSMIKDPLPTRAEVTDVANAVLDGADCLMLSGETSVGAHPIKVVEQMVRIIDAAEAKIQLKDKRPKPSNKTRTYMSDVICNTAALAADETGAKAIVGVTSSGYTAFRVSSFRPKTEIYIFSDRVHMLATLNLVWGVKCFYYDKFSNTDKTITDILKFLKEQGVVKKGDLVINTGSMPLHKRHRTNMLKLSMIE